VVLAVMLGFPDRLVPTNEKAAAILKQRTLTTLCNTRGTISHKEWIPRRSEACGNHAAALNPR